MNSPIIEAVLAAFEKAVSVASDINAATPFLRGTAITARAVFRQEMCSVRDALIAEEKSRKIALAELRKSIDEGLIEWACNSPEDATWETLKADFMTLVEPWLARLEQ